MASSQNRFLYVLFRLLKVSTALSSKAQSVYWEISILFKLFLSLAKRTERNGTRVSRRKVETTFTVCCSLWTWRRRGLKNYHYLTFAEEINEKKQTPKPLYDSSSLPQSFFTKQSEQSNLALHPQQKLPISLLKVLIHTEIVSEINSRVFSMQNMTLAVEREHMSEGGRGWFHRKETIITWIIKCDERVALMFMHVSPHTRERRSCS